MMNLTSYKLYEMTGRQGWFKQVEVIIPQKWSQCELTMKAKNASIYHMLYSNVKMGRTIVISGLKDIKNPTIEIFGIKFKLSHVFKL